MAPYGYFVMKFANQWVPKEHDLHMELAGREISSEIIAKSLHYFQVARNFKDLDSDGNRTFIAEKLAECSKYLSENNYQEKVDQLADNFSTRFGSRNLSAASKLLWLRKRSPVLIYDQWAKKALEKMENRKIDGYTDYCDLWHKKYWEDKAKIVAASKDFVDVRSYSRLWDKSIVGAD